MNKQAYEDLKLMLSIGQKYGLTVAEAETLVAFQDCGIGANAAEVGKVNGRQGGTVSEILTVLKNKGVITYETNEYGRKKYATIQMVQENLK